MSEADKGGATAPTAASLADAVVAALANHEGERAARSDEPVVSVVSVGGAVAVGDKKPEDPVVSVAAATEAEAAEIAPASPEASGGATSTAPGSAPQAAASAAEAPTVPPTSGPDEKIASEITRPLATVPEGPAGDELTAPRGLSVTRTVPTGIALRYFGRTDVGLVREHNEDNFLVVDVSLSKRGIDDKPIDATLGDRGCVLAVCDGMGGAAAGEVASQMAVDTIHEMMTAGGPPKDRDHFARRLVRAVEEAGSRIFSAAKLDRSRRGMGTTSTVAGLVDNTLFVGQVGDSRAYVLRGDQFALITKDQSLVNQLIEAGQLTEEEAEAFEHSNIILQALGTTEEVTVDLTFLELRRGDRLLLCSDGLSGLVHADMMKDVLRASRDLVDAAHQLIAMANAGGGHDNITVVLAEFDGLGLKEPDGSAKVAYQQYPLPPASPDTIDPPPPRPSSVKPSATKPGADVKGIPSIPPAETTGGLGRWWLVAVLVLLVLALLGAIMLSMDPSVSAERPTTTTRTTLSRSAPPVREAATAAREEASGFLRFDATHVGAVLEIDGVRQGTIAGTSMVVAVRPGPHHVSVLRDDALVASADVQVLAGHHEFVRLEPVLGAVTQRTSVAGTVAAGSEPSAPPPGVEPPPPPTGVEPPEDMAPLPADDDVEDGDRVASRSERRGDGPASSDGFVRRSGDTAHEPAPRPPPAQ